MWVGCSVSARTLMIELALFFLSGGVSCICSGLKVWLPILKGEDNPDDNVYRWLSLGGLFIFLFVKKGIVYKLKDAEIDRILRLEPSRRYFYLCYSLPRVLFLAIMISTFKIVEIKTERYYASRMIFGSSATAIGILLTACCLAILKQLGSDESLGRLDQDGAQRLEDSLMDVV